MNISIVTVFPSIYDSFLQTSLVRKAQENGLVNFNLCELASFCTPGKRIDEPTVGHGPGMILKPEIVEMAIESCIEKFGPGYKIFFSPQGQRLDQPLLNRIVENQFKPKDTNAKKDVEQHLILVCARYEGMDKRVEEHYSDLMLSIGDYVLMGGDLPAQVFLEGFLRLIPEVVGNKDSLSSESFQSPFLDHPEYGLPQTWNGSEIPEVLRSGNHKAIKDWREATAAKNTALTRFDWFRSQNPNSNDQKLARQQIPPHYVVHMHADIVTAGGSDGTTSVTSIDIHDIARSCATYGVKKFFLVTPLLDQQAIIKEFTKFWLSERGANYNKSRFEAISILQVCSSFDEVLERIEAIEGTLPIKISTSAKKAQKDETVICYNDQEVVWTQNKPVLIILGSGQGLSQKILDASEYLLTPVCGMTDYNHLSVRSAAAIIIDRWLGLNPSSNPGKGG
jgi:tRNA (guanine37-N1)-methyltransferase